MSIEKYPQMMKIDQFRARMEKPKEIYKDLSQEVNNKIKKINKKKTNE